jgi:hypothetical protein
MNDTKPIAIIAVLLVVFIAGGAWWMLRRGETPANTSASAVSATDAPIDRRGEAPVTLPPLSEMDGFLRPLLSALSTRPELAAWLATDDLVRQMAFAIDQAAAGSSPARDFKVIAPKGAFTTTGRGRSRTIDPASYRRYDGVVATITSIDPAAVAKIYRTIQPRLDEAYRGMGNPGGDVDRALQQSLAILLDTPVVTDPIRVVEAGGAAWEYADPKLESLEPTQKQLLRLGPRHTEAVLTWLRALNTQLNF